MNNFTIYLATLLCLLASKVLGQETFETRAKNIAAKIETITKEEKSALKEEVEAVNNQLEKGSITLEQAENKKKVLAEARAINIEARFVAPLNSNSSFGDNGNGGNYPTLTIQTVD